MRLFPLLGAGLAVTIAAGLVLRLPVGGEAVSVASEHAAAHAAPQNPELESLSSDALPAPLRLLFIHHSIGGQLLAEPGPEKALADSIYATHPNGGDLRKLLAGQGYEVHETSYGSTIGDKTDLFDWLPKFRGQMDGVLATAGNDKSYDGGLKNQVVVFKSCYPNSKFVADGETPGNPNGPELTVANAKATLAALLPEMARHPDVLYVYVTAPPMAPRGYRDPLWKFLVKGALRKPQAADILAAQASRARTFNTWVTSPEGWLEGYPHKNVVVFDLYGTLTDDGESNFSRYPTGANDDSHPSRLGNAKVAARFVPFLNRAVRRAGLVPAAAAAGSSTTAP